MATKMITIMISVKLNFEAANLWYKHLNDAMMKASDWMKEARNIRIVNIQTLETILKQSPENVRTGRNFLHNAHRRCKVRFLRISYTTLSQTPLSGSTTTLQSNFTLVPSLESTPPNIVLQQESNGETKRQSLRKTRVFYKTPSGLSYKTFMPSAVKIGMCTGAPQYEKFSSVWMRSRAWLQCVDRKVVTIETVHHPLKLAWNQQDCGETTSLCPHQNIEANIRMVQLIRVYMDGDYTEPSTDQLPMLPPVEEVNDCFCVVC
ncbi:hypothetical protein HELRODRAFT_170926 [Helobdella robusta]|uniref:Uncharacterized protein n=1 Tax=Helobdella robusta TaxID=6412 RepID=T1F3L7_HELRO|nr:hypothetical protein HELRODRAFT_170926 [Helobdella robusta]ESO06891.1 hypothetical protein HELRODRAFT_170926 [Helobdella robusta]